MSDLKICRICLIKGVRGYKMDQYNLRHCYEQIMRAKVNDREGLPLWFCYECATMLHKFDKFKDRCNKGQTTLRQMLWSKGISYPAVGVINRFSENLVSPVGIIMSSKQVKTIFSKHRNPALAKKAEKPNVQFIEETAFKSFSFDDEKTVFAESVAVNPLEKGIKEESEQIKDEQKIAAQVNNFDMDMGVDAMDSDSDGDIFLHTTKLSEKPKEPNDDIDIDNIMNEIMASDVPIEKPIEVEPPKTKNGKKPVKKGYKNVYGILIPKTASDKPKAKKFETKKRDMNPEHWKKINMSEEEAIMEVKQRANSDKFLKANFKCHECFKGFSKLDMLMRHAKQYHDETCGAFLCRFCHMRFPRKWALTRHMTEHYIMFECRRCDMRFREKSALFHDDVHNGVIRKCEHCGKEFVHSSTYYTHLRMTHRSNHICTLCGASFVSELGLLKHKRIAHYEEKESETFCTPSTSSLEALEMYCDKCDIKFMSRRAYNEHLANSNNHGDAAENIKAKDFRQKKIPTACTHCGQNFPSRQAYKKHHLTEHSHIPFDDRAICEVCGVSLSIAKELNTEACSIVDRVFTYHQAGSVSQHMVTHTGERPHACALCDKRFTQKSAMKMHYKTVHLKQPYPKYPRRKPYRRKKKTEEIPQNDFTAFIRPGYYS